MTPHLTNPNPDPEIPTIFQDSTCSLCHIEALWTRKSFGDGGQMKILATPTSSTGLEIPIKDTRFTSSMWDKQRLDQDHEESSGITVPLKKGVMQWQ
jgi:hypothetical protein